MPTTTNYSQRLQHVATLKKVDQVDLVKQLGIDKSTISKWWNGINVPRPASNRKIAAFFGCNETWLRTGKGEPFPSYTEVVNETAIAAPLAETSGNNSKVRPARSLPVLGKVPAGIAETITDDMVDEYITLPDVPANSYAVKIHGQSMEPTIMDEDYVIFAIDRDLQHNDIVVVRDEYGDPMIKRYKLKEDEVRLVSDNPKYETIIPNGDYTVIGVVVKVWRDVKI